MKKIILVSSCLLLSLILWMGNSTAKPVDTLTAKTVATHFLAGRNVELPRSAQQARIAYIGHSFDESSQRSVPCYYIVNLNQGFVILSADNRIEPILGYSTEGNFNTEDIPDNMLSFLDGYSAQIKAFLHDTSSTPNEATAKWTSLIRDDYTPNSTKGAIVGPLLTTTWDQNSPYNALCPTDASATSQHLNGHVYAGCVATAMAQVIRYWQYPCDGAGGTKTFTYNNQSYSVNFNIVHYDYSKMPDFITTSSPSNQITEVAKLTYHCGVSAAMEYGITYGSSASLYNACNALNNNFSYNTTSSTMTPENKYRSSFSDNDWINLLKTELNAWRPILYRGQGSSGGHAFVCDGYDDQNYFHFNWGWSGSYNGYFLVSALSTGNGSFNSSQQAIIHIQGNTPMIKTGSPSLSFLCAANTVSESKSLPLHGVALSSNIVITAPANFEVSTDGTTFSTSLNVNNTASSIYVRYAPTASGQTTDHGTLTLTSGTVSKTVALSGHTYALDCNAPQNVQHTADNSGNVQLSWNAPTQDIHTYKFSIDSTNGGIAGLGATRYVLAQRACDSDLVVYHQKRITQVSFYIYPFYPYYSNYPEMDIVTNSSERKIVIYQGGSFVNNALDEGTLIREQTINSFSYGWNTVTLSEPVTIDANQELWYGVHFYTTSSYPIAIGDNPGVAGKGDLVKANGSWTLLSSFDPEYGLNHNIPLKITIQDSPSSIANYTIERNDNIVGTITNTQYNDHVTNSGTYTYNVTANWDNGCSATSNDITINVITDCTTTYGDTLVNACESFTWHDSTYTVTPATYPTFTMVGGNSVGCDSVVRLHLTINQKHFFPENVMVAQSSLPYNWHGHTFYTDTTAYDSLFTTAGCDSVFFLTLTVTPFNLVQDNPIVLCQGETENWRGHLLSQSGIYRDTVIASNTIYTVVVTVNPKYFFPENITVTQGSLPYNWHGHTFYTDTTAYDSLFTTAGCDSVFFLTLTVTPFNIVQDSPIVLCQGETENWHGHQISESGTYQDTVFAENTIYRVLVTVNPKYFFPENVTVNQGSLPYNWHGHTFYSDITAYDSLQTVATGCDSVFCLTLTVVPYSVIADAPIVFCEGEAQTWRGHLLTESQEYRDTVETENTIYTVVVTINPTQFTTLDSTVCDSIVWRGKTYRQSQTIVDTLATTNGCDSIVTLHLTVSSSYYIPETATIPQAQLPYLWHGQSFMRDTIVYDSLQTVATGCDSVYYLTLTVVPYFVTADDPIVFCEGETETWRDHLLTESREYRDTVAESNTIYTVQVTIKPMPVFTLTLEKNKILCAHDTLRFSSSLTNSSSSDNIVWSWSGPNNFESSLSNPVVSNNATPDHNGNYSVTVVVTQNGCTKEDSATVHVTVNAPATGTVTVSGNTVICHGNSTTLTASATGNTGDMTYQWSFGLSPISDTEAVASPAFSTIYTVTATATVGNCTATTTKQVVASVRSLPIVTIEGDDTICSGTSGTLTAYPNNSLYSWSWSNGDSTQHITVQEQGTYSVTVTDENGCQNSISTTITVLSLPLMPQCSTQPNTSCTSDNGSITVTNPIGPSFTYSIDSEHFQDSTTFQNLADGSYNVTVKNSDGCINLTTVSVDAIGNIVNAQATANTPCAGQNITLFGSSSTSGVSYSWTGPNNYASDEQNPVIPNASSEIAGSYYLTVTQTSTNCSKTVPVTVQVNTPSVTLASISDTAVCVGGDILLNVALSCEPTGSVTYLWTSNTGYSSTQQNNTIHNAETVHAGTYEVVATASQTVNGTTCTVTDSKMKSVTVNPLPNIIISGENSTCKGVPATWTASGANSYLWSNNSTSNPIQVSEAGTYIVEGTDANGCVNTATKSLIVNVPQPVTIQHIACESYEWHDSTYTTSGIYTYSHPDAQGCTQVDTLKLTINYGTHNTSAISSCNQYTWDAPSGTTYTTDSTSVLIDHYNNGVNCPSADTLTVTIYSTKYTDLHVSICENELPYHYVNGQIDTTFDIGTPSLLTVPYPLSSVNGCDSIVTLHLTVKQSVTELVEATACDSYTWNDSTYAESGVYSKIFTAANGCDSTVTLNLTINHSVTELVEATACDSYTWNDSTYTESGIYSNTFLAANGCDSTITLHLIINHAVTELVEATACDSYTWNDSTYTVSGVYSKILTAGNGCDSTITLHLTVNYAVTEHVEATACDSYTWHDSTYFENGTYVFEYLNNVGCPSTDTLHLIINHAVNTVAEAEAVEAFVWHRAGAADTTITSSGTYTHTHPDNNGCTQTDTLHLTIYHATNTQIDTSACEEFLWHRPLAGDTIITNSGTYIDNFTDVHGADSVVTLVLTIYSTEHTDLHVSICENELPYHYISGQIDTTFEVGTPSLVTVPYTLSTANGCDSIVTLNLTVNPTYAIDTAVTITTNDLPYHFVSGQIDTTFEVGSPSLLTVPYTLSTVDGCDSTVTLHLTINVGIENHTAELLRAFPNPTTGHVTVIGSEEFTQLQLFDAYGRRVGIYPVEGTQTEIDLHGLASGVYFLKAMREKQTAGTLKIIKSKE